MTRQTTTQPTTTTAQTDVGDRRLETQPRLPRVAFDYDPGHGRRSGYTGARRYSDMPGRALFHCG
ncbi:MAG: hypothetical protein ABIQ97_07170 [Lysobacteraceae bacterium]